MVTSTQDTAESTFIEKWQDRWDGRLGDYVWLGATVVPLIISTVFLYTFTILLLIH